MKTILPAIVVGVLSPIAVRGEDNSESLQTAANDPTASIMSFPAAGVSFVQSYITRQRTAACCSSAPRSRLRWGQTNHIARLTLPYVTDSANGQSGLSDTTLFDLMTFARSLGSFRCWRGGLVAHR